MNTLLKTMLITSAVLMCGTSAAARRNRTTRTIPAAERAAMATDILPDDTIHAPQLVLYGYDKPAASTRESIIVDNRTGRHLTSLVIELRYTDTRSRLLHSCTVTIPCDIHPGDTQLVSWPSWDRQQSFYYINSRQPNSRRRTTPYDINATVNIATAKPAE